MSRTAAVDIPAISSDTPLRLAEAVALAFPAGGMTVSGLRREIARGRLPVEMIAGKQFVTLDGIAHMRQLCRVQVKVHVCSSAKPAMAPVARSEERRVGK